MGDLARGCPPGGAAWDTTCGCQAEHFRSRLALAEEELDVAAEERSVVASMYASMALSQRGGGSAGGSGGGGGGGGGGGLGYPSGLVGGLGDPYKPRVP